MSGPIAWTEVRVQVPRGWQELVAEALSIGPCTSAAFGRASLAAEEAPSDREVVRLFLPDHADSPELRAELARAAAALAARRDVLTGLVAGGEGLTAGTRVLLEAARTGALEGIEGTVADLVGNVGDEAAALDQALGDLAGAVVCDTTA